MLTNFFGKSKPINFIIVSIYIISWILFKLIIEPGKPINAQAFAIRILIILGFFLLLFLLNFIIRKNQLTKANTYSILFFSCFIAMTPGLINDGDTLLANLFLLLALRRILSMPSGKNMEKKILDASIWISVASLFYFWSVLLFIVLFISILQSGSKNLKLLLIPFVGFLTVLTLVTTYSLLANDSFLWFLDIKTNISFDYSAYQSTPLIIPISFFSITMIWGIIQKAFSISKSSLKEKANFKTLFIVILTFVIMVLLDPNKNGGELLFIMAPLAIITTNIIEIRKEFWVKELFLWTVVLLPVIINFFITI